MKSVKIAKKNIQVIRLINPIFGLDGNIYPGEYKVKGTWPHQLVTVCIPDFSVLPFMPASGSLLGNLTSALLMASVIGLYLTIITHLVFSELRNLPGLNLLAMNMSMVLYQQLFLAGISPKNHHWSVCKGVALGLHFLILCTFFWTNVMAWDLYQTFGQKAEFF